MTPLEFAKDVLATASALFDDADLPSQRFAKWGEAVIDCESLIVAATGLTQSPQPNCACGLITLTVSLARGCADEANDDGTNNVEAIVAISESMEDDNEILMTLTHTYVGLESWSMNWIITGGLAINALTLTMPLPCGPATDGS